MLLHRIKLEQSIFLFAFSIIVHDYDNMTWHEICPTYKQYLHISNSCNIYPVKLYIDIR